MSKILTKLGDVNEKTIDNIIYFIKQFVKTFGEMFDIAFLETREEVEGKKSIFISLPWFVVRLTYKG